MIAQIQLPDLNSFVIMFAGGLNVVGIVWAAAKITAKLETLVTAFDEYRVANDIRVSIIETRQSENIKNIAIILDRDDR